MMEGLKKWKMVAMARIHVKWQNVVGYNIRKQILDTF